MKQIAEIDKEVNRSTDNDEEFLKNFETQQFLLEATKKLCEEKGIELIIFPRDSSSPEDSAVRIKNLLEEKLVKSKTTFGMWPSGKAPGLGPGDREFESRRSDHFYLSSSFLFLALLENEECLVSIQKENIRQHSENFSTHLQQILSQTNHTLKEIKEVYFTSHPSGQTGLRVGLAFLATCQALNSQIKIYHLDSLLFQMGGIGNFISLLTINSQGDKYHVATYQNKKCLLTSQIVYQAELEKIKEKFTNFLILKDFEEVDFLTNFQKLKNDFRLLKKIEEINL
ncbi:1149_t:CDS:2 [Funneliformis geosporum]|uniref:1149_t:CDS:1 n=1 Tax=Funneliformis geosporum TaxID=1117311 RepID=A0A9W4SVW9_9GLOM|nr:1149_t:CDS:2 [Funneliformis geosporum]